jgi:hypothetical protein
LEAGKRVVLEDALLMIDLRLDVIASATRSPGAGILYAHEAIDHGKHVVMIDKEADSVVGPTLKYLADFARDGTVTLTCSGAMQDFTDLHGVFSLSGRISSFSKEHGQGNAPVPRGPFWVPMPAPLWVHTMVHYRPHIDNRT